jgi:hypothetical protein
VRGCLQECPIPSIREVSCEYDQGVIVLRGRVPTYYYKQLSQEAAARFDGVVQVVNNIEVE